MGDEEKKDLVESAPVEGPPDSRTGIMRMLSPVIETALTASGLDLKNPVILRRYYRAMVHLALQKLLDVGAPPEFLVAQTFEALQHELEARQPPTDDSSTPTSTMLN